MKVNEHVGVYSKESADVNNNLTINDKHFSTLIFIQTQYIYGGVWV